MTSWLPFMLWIERSEGRVSEGFLQDIKTGQTHARSSLRPDRNAFESCQMQDYEVSV